MKIMLRVHYRYGPFDTAALNELDRHAPLMCVSIFSIQASIFFIRYVIFLCERFCEASAETGYLPPTVLVDLKGLHLGHIAMLGWCREWASAKQDNYSYTPGTHMYLCGVSPAITTIW